MKVFIPENLELSSRHRDKYYYIVGLIYKEAYHNKKYDEESYIPLSSIELHKILGGRYKNYLMYLLDNNIIEGDNFYIEGKKCKGYRLTEKYKKQKFRIAQLHYPHLLKKLKCHNKAQVFYLEQNDTFAHLRKCLNNVEIDYNGALEYIHQNVTEPRKIIRSSMLVEKIYSGDFYCKVDNTAGRLHTNLTSMPKELRRYLSYQQKQLVEVDIANSQPLLFNILVYKYFNEINNNRSICNNSIYLTRKSTSISNYEDALHYQQLTEEGILYEYLMEKLEYKGDRNKFKKLLFEKVFYCEGKPNYVYKERKVFTKEFPTIAEIISYYKKENYKNLPIQLQKVEADFILHTIVPILKDKSIYTLTIHDSILTTKENANKVKSIMKTEFKNKFNLNPTIRIK